MAAASHLQPAREYLLWWEAHRDRWIAAPIVRTGTTLIEIDYRGAVTVRLVPNGDTAGT